jgi:hypothetical protein
MLRIQGILPLISLEKLKIDFFSNILLTKHFREKWQIVPTLLFNLGYFGMQNFFLAPTIWPPQKMVKKLNRPFFQQEKNP